MDATQFGERAPGRLISIAGGALAYGPAPLPPAAELGAVFIEYGQAMAGTGMLNAKIAPSNSGIKHLKHVSRKWEPVSG